MASYSIINYHHLFIIRNCARIKSFEVNQVDRCSANMILDLIASIFDALDAELTLLLLLLSLLLLSSDVATEHNGTMKNSSPGSCLSDDPELKTRSLPAWVRNKSQQQNNEHHGYIKVTYFNF